MSAINLAARLLRRLERLTMGRRAYKWIVRDWLPPGDLRAASAVLGTMRFIRQIEPQPMAGPAARDILVLAPHPDDEVIGPGGTLIRAARAGQKVSVLFVTSGKGEEAAERVAEARMCCASLGFEATYLGGIAGQIGILDPARAIAEVVARIRPGAIFVPFVLDDHADHRRVNEVLLHALAGAKSADAEIWAYQVYSPLPGNVVVDVTDVIGAKADAIRIYRSQMAHRDWAHFALGLNAFNCRLLQGVGGARYAESFFVVPSGEYVEICRQYFRLADTYPGVANARQ